MQLIEYTWAYQCLSLRVGSLQLERLAHFLNQAQVRFRFCLPVLLKLSSYLQILDRYSTYHFLLSSQPRAPLETWNM